MVEHSNIGNMRLPEDHPTVSKALFSLAWKLVLSLIAVYSDCESFILVN
jgi:hypothetical protein